MMRFADNELGSLIDCESYFEFVRGRDVNIIIDAGLKMEGNRMGESLHN